MNANRVDGRRTCAVLAGGVVLALMAAPAQAQLATPFKSVNFAAPVLAAADTPADQQPAAGDPAQAAPTEPGYVTFFKSVELGGLADAYYSYFSTKQPALYHSFDGAHNQFTLSMAEIWLAKTPAADSPLGFKVKMNFGPAASIINFNEPNKDLLNIQEGFVSYLAPAGKGLQIDIGKFVTNAGAEVIEAKDNYNYSRSLLFQNAIPYYHVGVRATYNPNDKVSLMGGLVNGWNNAVDSNTGKTVMFSVTGKPDPKWTLIENYIGGPEQPADNSDWRNLSDTVVTFAASPALSVTGNYDYGHDTVSKTAMTWQGFAGSLKYQANKIIAVSPRAEYLNDGDGFSTGTAQKLKEFTFTLEIKPVDNFMWRIEYRGDFSDIAVFKDDAGKMNTNQQALILGFLVNFSTK